jgi:hypothetical protein
MFLRLGATLNGKTISVTLLVNLTVWFTVHKVVQNYFLKAFTVNVWFVGLSLYIVHKQCCTLYLLFFYMMLGSLFIKTSECPASSRENC